MKANDEALIELIKRFEGCRLESYLDLRGRWTVGYGHSGPDVMPGLVISQLQAEDLLKADLLRFELYVQLLVKPNLNANQMAALTSFAYNVGDGYFATSTLLKLVNMKEDPSEEFLRWDKVNGRPVEGLLTRRRAERDLYRSL